jgi:predicted metal-dependent phosphoesterase TrpH
MIMNYSSTVLQAPPTLTLKEVWAKTQEHSCPYYYNFHLHTRCSDGQLTPEALMQQAYDLGLAEMAITDHHHIQGYDQAQQWLHQAKQENPERSCPRLWIGVEVTSNLQGSDVHLLAYDFNPQEPELQVYFTGESPQGEHKEAQIVIQRFQQAGGLVILAHPARYRRPAQDLIPLAVQCGIDGVEAYYAYNNPKPWQPSLKETQQVIAIAQQYDLLLTCGTDTHGLNILHRL